MFDSFTDQFTKRARGVNDDRTSVNFGRALSTSSTRIENLEFKIFFFCNMSKIYKESQSNPTESGL